MKSSRVLLAGAASAVLVAAASPAAAQAYYLQEQSARAAGRAYSGEAADTGVSSLWWNPAAIARSGREVYVGVHAIGVKSEVADTGTSLTYPGGVTVPVSGTDASGPIESGIVPNFAIATPVGDRFAVGLSVAAPYNFTTKYETDSFARYDALTSELRSADVGLTAAMRVTDWLDLGVGVDAQFVDAKLTSALPNLSPLLADGMSSLEGDGWDYGWNAGAQAHFGRFDIGLSYRSAIEHELDGDVVIAGLLGPLEGANVTTSDGVARFTTPSFVALSARYRLNDRLTLNAQVNRIGWSEFDAIDVVYPTGGQTIVQDYKDVTTGSVGFDYAASDTLTFRGGLGYTPTPTRDTERTARIPDADRWLVSGGLSARATERLTVDFGLTYVAFQDSEIFSDRTLYPGTPAATTSRLRGTAEGFGLAWSLGTRWSF
ncbi:MAG: outer membrane protein transport protein [Pseudomonadota bacterium]|nr:outer membrane protein transport protein [Pseudomonadota bacterium]